MKEKLSAFKVYYKAHPKRFWFGGILVVGIIFMILSGGDNEVVTVIPVERTDLKETVLATGQVTSSTDLSLSFLTSDIVRTIPVSVGTKVKEGQVLATLDNRDEYASLLSAKAKYGKVIEGATTEEVAVAQASLTSAQSALKSAQNTQDTLVENAHRSLLNADLDPVLTSGVSGTSPTVTGTYVGSAEGSYVIVLHSTGAGGYFTYSGVEEGTGEVSTSAPKPLGTKGLFIQFPSDFASHLGDVWTVYLPNTKSTQYLTAYNAYQNALKTRDSALAAAQAQVDEAEASLALKKAAARPSDLEEAQSQVLIAQAAYDKTILRAPADGTVVRVDTKIGERAEPGKEVIVVQDVSNLYVEADINEANIAKVALGQPVTMTLDAYGPTMKFSGSVVHIDPSASTEDGVVNYMIKASLESVLCGGAVCPAPKDLARPGMNANMTITASDTPNVLAVPKAAVTTDETGSKVFRITNMKRKKYSPAPVTLGKEGDGNLVEVVSGLSDGDSIVLVEKK